MAAAATIAGVGRTNHFARQRSVDADRRVDRRGSHRIAATGSDRVGQRFDRQSSGRPIQPTTPTGDRKSDRSGADVRPRFGERGAGVVGTFLSPTGTKRSSLDVFVRGSATKTDRPARDRSGVGGTRVVGPDRQGRGVFAGHSIPGSRNRIAGEFRPTRDLVGGLSLAGCRVVGPVAGRRPVRVGDRGGRRIAAVDRAARCFDRSRTSLPGLGGPPKPRFSVNRPSR